MAIEVAERYASRTLAGDKARRGYRVTGTTDDAEARAAVLSTAPASVGLLVRLTTDVQVVQTEDGIWDAEVTYQIPSGHAIEVGDSTFTFDIAGQAQRITQSLQTVSTTPGSARDFKQAIGVNQDANGGLNVEGVDIQIPTYAFSETHILSDDTVDYPYRGTLFELAGTVNNADFKGLAAGECLMVGVSGHQRADADWELTFSFLCLPNRTDLVITDSITVASKDGWDYLWVLYEDFVDSLDGWTRQAVAAYVERVYERQDFSQLGIGT